MIDLDLIKQQVKDVVEFSQSFQDANVDKLIDDWYDAKRKFIEAFEGKAILEVPLHYPLGLSEEEKKNRIESFISYIHYNISNADLEEFCEENKSGFFDNVVLNDYYYNDKKIPKGMKLTRAFKYFEPSQHKVDLAQTTASKYIQENKLIGTLCISVHPLDFLSSSENTYNWHSCHALDGEYRAGNLSYMCDRATLIAYVKGVDNVILPDFPENVPWNNKKWRMLIYMSDNWDLMFAGRHYPFTCMQAAERARQHLLTALQGTAYNYHDWTDPIVGTITDSHGNEFSIHERYFYIMGEIKNVRDIVYDDPINPLHYNDVLKGTYRPHYSMYKNFPWGHFSDGDKIHVGSDCKCLKCGTRYIINPSIMMCDDCDYEFGVFDEEVYFICDSCNRRAYRDDSYYVGNEMLCPSCFDASCFYCEDCGENYYLDDEHYVEELGRGLCEYCYNEYMREKSLEEEE